MNKSEIKKNNIKLSIIIVNWNVLPLLKRCIFSICKNIKDINYEIIVVDNDSKDGSKTYLKGLEEKRDNVEIILNNKNLGFATANNKGLKIAKGKFILFLNPDTEITSNTIEKLMQELENNNDIGIIAPKILGVDGKHQPSVRAFPSILSQILIFLKLHHIFPNTPVLKKYFQHNFDYKKQQEAEQVMGAAMLARKQALDKVGYWDENFFLWFEEVDLCKRIKQAGWEIVYTPKAQILHHGGESFAQMMGLKKQNIYNKSAIYYFKKHSSFEKYWPLLVLHPFSLCISLIVQILNISGGYGFPKKD